MADKQTSLIYIDKTKVWFYVGATGEILSLDIPSTVVRDMEVLNREFFSKQFESFLSTHKIPTSRINIVIASSLLFVKDISGVEQSKHEEAIKEFVENVPFDSTAKVVVHQEKTFRLVVSNKDQFTLMKRSLEKNKFEVTLVLPEILIPNISVQGALDVQTAQMMLDLADGLKVYSLLDAPLLTPLQNITANASDKGHPKRLPILLSAFGGLVSILIGVAVVSNSQPTVTSSQAKGLVTPAVIAPPSVTLQTLRVDVIRATQTASTSAQLITAIKSTGITDVKEIVRDVGLIDATEVVFSQSVPVSLQEQLIKIVKATIPAFGTKVVTGLGRDVEIRMGSVN